ncbi:hypothetical protein JKP88DRAFT_277201 [Tribonema minus]|uniref:Uncharacterized protein n=1 Tax=Tribonema minus TaxID=303371 RepID=A0A835YZS8_9STRA|nr:hypothetical protein JKP88DRAFT_277201 [Tribonema minus]
MSVPGGARPKALKGIALARLRSALSAALHMAYSGRVMTHTAESRGGGHMEEDVGEDPEMPFGGGGAAAAAVAAPPAAAASSKRSSSMRRSTRRRRRHR